MGNPRTTIAKPGRPGKRAKEPRRKRDFTDPEWSTHLVAWLDAKRLPQPGSGGPTKTRKDVLIGFTKLDGVPAGIVVGQCRGICPWHSGCHLPHAIVHLEKLEMVRCSRVPEYWLSMRREQYDRGETRDYWDIICEKDYATENRYRYVQPLRIQGPTAWDYPVGTPPTRKDSPQQ